MKDDPKRPFKAAVACVLAGLTALGTALADGHVTTLEGVGIATAVVFTFGGAYGVTNPQVPE